MGDPIDDSGMRPNDGRRGVGDRGPSGGRVGAALALAVTVFWLTVAGVGAASTALASPPSPSVTSPTAASPVEGAPTGGSAAATLCAAPEEFTSIDTPLVHLAARIGEARQGAQPSGASPAASKPGAAPAGAALVVVLGTGSSAGNGVSAPTQAFPQRLAVDLVRLLPEARLAVRTLATRGATVGQMVRRIEKEVLPMRPALVVWQIGATDAVDGISINLFGHQLERGLTLLNDAGIDVVLMDMQYSPYTELLINAGDYRHYVRWIARSRGIALMRRYEMMHYWSDENVFDLNSDDPAVRLRTADAVHGCVARQLAAMIRSGLQAAQTR